MADVKNSILYTGIIDNFPVTSYFSSGNNITTKKVIISKRIFSNNNIDKFVQMVTNANWSDAYVDNCANKASSIFTEKIQ